MINKIHQSDALTFLRTVESCTVNTCITSPPYWQLRDYGMDGQIGLEDTPEQYIEKMVGVFREVRRVLRDDGTLWVNIGDSYARSEMTPHGGQLANRDMTKMSGARRSNKDSGLKRKDLVGIPWMLAFALRADGWYLRQDIIWHKPNPMPEAVTDRCTKSHEYIFLLSKQEKYYFDAQSIKTQAKPHSPNGSHFSDGTKTTTMIRQRSGNKERKPASARGVPEGSTSNVCGSFPWEGDTANKRDVWTVQTKPFKEAHFATFPQELVIDMVKAGCPGGGIVLDPFFGSGTTGIVARKLNRNFIGIELNPEYIEIANKRMSVELGMFS